MKELRPPGAGRRYAWLALIYLASGYPFGLFKKTVPIYLGRLKVGEDQIGLLSVVALPWSLKFLWAPWVDRLGERRHWMTACLAALAGLLLLYSFLPESPEISPVAWAVLGLVAMASATQDVAIDAYSVEAFEGRQVGNASGVRVNAYRIAFLLAGGLLVGRASSIGWAGVWRVSAGVLAALAVATAFLPRAPRTKPVGQPVIEPFRRLATRPGFAAIAAFVLLFKLGDYAMGPMTDQFLIRPNGAGFTDSQIGDLVTPIGIFATIVGALIGGALTTRWGIFRALWVLGLFQAVSNLGYAWAAIDRGPVVVWGAAVVEPFCGGLGTAPFVAFLMASCERAHAGTQYAVLSALFALGREGAGAISGFGVKAMSYAPYFGATFLVALPAFALLPAVKRWLADREREAAAASPPPAPPPPR